MSANNNHIKNYSATDIQQYLQGKLSAQAMHDLEKAALDDPFLADAIEGMQQQEPAAFNTGMQELTKRLKNRIATKNKSKLFFLLPRSNWWKAAAIVLILAGAGGPLYMFLSGNSQAKNTIAATKQEPVMQDSIAQKSAATRFTAPANTDSSTPANKPASTTAMRDITAGNQSAPAMDKITKSDSRNEEKKKSGKDMPISIRQETPADKAGLINFKADSIPTSIAASSPATVETVLAGKVAGVEVSRQRNENYINSFEGVILDEYKNPVRGATVKMKNRKTATLTDSHGAFKLNTGSKDSLVNVVVHSVGFQPASFVLKHADTIANTLQLQSNASALNEVVVVGYGVQRKRNLTAEDSTALDSIALQQEQPEVQAMPVIGWEEYNTYLAKNKKITTADSTRKGKEIISFLLDQKGNRSGFKIKKSLSPAHDAEAIRLVKEGPTWQLLSGKKARIRVTIEF